jgi:hypothetical protein
LTFLTLGKVGFVFWVLGFVRLAMHQKIVLGGAAKSWMIVYV